MVARAKSGILLVVMIRLMGRRINFGLGSAFPFAKNTPSFCFIHISPMLRGIRRSEVAD